MNVGIVTNSKAPYRKLQLEEVVRQNDINLTVYYTDKFVNGRSWNVDVINGAKEILLKGYRLSKKYGFINVGLINIVKSNQLIIIGGYEQPTYILLSLICRLLKKPYVILFDGISPSKINTIENKLKYYLKNIVISNANSIFANGSVSRKYFNEKFGVNHSKIFNQYLTVDVEKIFELSKDKRKIRENIRKMYNIDSNKIVVIYSGRLIKRKNIDVVIEAMSRITDKDNYVFLVVGDGPEKSNLLNLASQLNVECVITGFIENQEELFEYYFSGDILVLPSYDEPWGLVVNEAMASGLPIILSDECGCSLDLVKNENGIIIKAGAIDELTGSILKIVNDNKNNYRGELSKDIIKKWTFKESAKELKKIIDNINSENKNLK